MTTGSWNEVDRVLGDALECAHADREAFVERACAGRPELAAEVRSLLAEHDRGGPLDALDALGGGEDARAVAWPAGASVRTCSCARSAAEGWARSGSPSAATTSSRSRSR